MNIQHISAMSIMAAAALTACGSTPPTPSTLALARQDYLVAQANPQTSGLAAGELKEAGTALQKATDAANRNESTVTIDHLAYLARQRVAIADETGKLKSAELQVSNASADRNRIQLAARTREADTAQREAEEAKRQTRESQMRNSALEAQIRDLHATQTPRGLVITISDVLFAINQAELERGASNSLTKLVSFLNQNPQRKVLIEGFTDSTGGEALNLELSNRRSQAVRLALVQQGISNNRIATQGYGEAYPVADNTTAMGRQQNRRVEIILSDEAGTIAPR